MVGTLQGCFCFGFGSYNAITLPHHAVTHGLVTSVGRTLRGMSLILVLSLMVNEIQEGVMLMKNTFAMDFITCALAVIDFYQGFPSDILPLGIGVARV